MNILSVENFNGYFTSQTSLWGSFHSTCDRLTYNFTPGVYVLSGEIDSGGWAFAASLYPQSSKNTIIFPDETTLYYMGKKSVLFYIFGFLVRYGQQNQLLLIIG